MGEGLRCLHLRVGKTACPAQEGYSEAKHARRHGHRDQDGRGNEVGVQGGAQRGGGPRPFLSPHFHPASIYPVPPHTLEFRTFLILGLVHRISGSDGFRCWLGAEAGGTIQGSDHI